MSKSKIYSLIRNGYVSPDPTAQGALYAELGDHFFLEKNRSSSVNSYSTYYSISRNIGPLATYPDLSSIGPTCNFSEYRQVISSLKDSGFSFMPSFVGPGHEDFQDIIHLHIPKCAGTSFSIAFAHSMLAMSNLETHLGLQQFENTSYSYNAIRKNIKKYKSIIFEPNIGNSWKAEAFSKLLQNSNNLLNHPKYIVFHGASWSNISNLFSKFTDFNQRLPKIIVPIRKPNQRLLSHIKHMLHSFQNVEAVERDISQREWLYDNTMYRYVYDTCLFESRNNKKSQKTLDKTILDRMIFLDINKQSQIIEQYKSYILSALSFPNVLQFNRMNSAETRVLSKKYSKDVSRLYLNCLKRGFLDLDSELYKRQMDCHQKFNLSTIHSGEIHPFTIVISKERQCGLIPTRSLNEFTDHILKLQN